MPRGRPKGTDRPPTLQVRYPIKWRPIYDSFVADAVSGMSTKDIAAKHRYTPIQVGNVLNSPMAQEKLRDIGSKVTDLVVAEKVSIEDRHKRIKEKALQVAEDFLGRTDLQAAAPVMFVDRAIKLAAIGDTAKAANQTNVQINNQKTLVISAEAANNVSEALKLSKELGLGLLGNGS